MVMNALYIRARNDSHKGEIQVERISGLIIRRSRFHCFRLANSSAHHPMPLDMVYEELASFPDSN